MTSAYSVLRFLHVLGFVFMAMFAWRATRTLLRFGWI